MKKLAVALACLSGILAFAGSAASQTITVDISHPSNHFVPNETLGAGVDRIAVEAIDKDLLPPTLEKTLASGWQPVTYRQNTELAVEAWHWNPQGTWSDRVDGSDAGGKGYFTGSATPTEMLRYSYGYALPRRGFTRNDGTDKDSPDDKSHDRGSHNHDFFSAINFRSIGSRRNATPVAA